MSKWRRDDLSWGQAWTFEEWLRHMIRVDKESEILPILKVMPEDKKRRYREIWKEEQDRKKKK